MRITSKPIQLLVPMSGQGTRYQKAGYTEPKPLIPVNGKPMISRLLENFPTEWPATFILAENHRNTELPSVLMNERPQGRLHFIEKHAKGPSFAALQVLDALDAEAPVLVSYCDYAMVWDCQQFRRFVESSGCDACVISYRGYHAHYRSPQMYAYSRMEGERVVEVKEKGCFTENRENEFASAGAYYFKTVKILRQAIEHQLAMDLSLNGEYYTSLTVEALLRLNPKSHVRVFEIPGFFQWGTPEDLQISSYWEKSYSAHNQVIGEERPRAAQVLMPMAGLGSRFTAITSTPKPLIAMDGTAMFQRALDSLPFGEKTTLVAVQPYADLIGKVALPGTEIIALDSTPPGQALSTLAGLKNLEALKEIVVSSCDHAIVLPAARWEKFHSLPDCDAAIFTIQGFPGANARPKAYAYVVPKATGDYPEVARVSVKEPVSGTPIQDHVLVGTFWFRSVQLLTESILELKKREIRVNGEMYLDSVFAVLMEMGYRVRMIPLEGYLCWGDPENLSEAMYWQEMCGGYRIDRRAQFPRIEMGNHA